MTAVAPDEWRTALRPDSAKCTTADSSSDCHGGPSTEGRHLGVGKQVRVSAQAAEMRSLLGDYGALVQRDASRLSRKGRGVLEKADLVHEGLIGLIEAWNAYQADRGVPFYAYARLRVRGAMIDNIRREARMPRRLWTRMREIEERRTDLENQIGRRASLAELAGHCDVPVGLLPGRELQDHGAGLPDALPEPVDESADVMEAVERSQLTSALMAALKNLTDRQRAVIGLYYRSEMNQLQIGKLLDVTEGRVSQIRVQALDRLRAAFRRRGIRVVDHQHRPDGEDEANEAI